MSNSFKTFLIIDIILSVIIAIVGIVVFPLLAWIIDSGATIYWIMTAMLVIAALLVITGLTLIILNPQSVFNTNLKKVMLTLGISLGVVFGIHVIRFNLTGLDFAHKWGDCFYRYTGRLGGKIINCIGITKKSFAYRAYDENANDYKSNKVFITFTFETDVSSNKHYTMWLDEENVEYQKEVLLVSADEYDSYGNFMRKLDNRSYYYRFINNGEHQGDYYYDGKLFDRADESNLNKSYNLYHHLCGEYLKHYDIVIVY